MARYRFRPSLIPSLATLILLPALIGLGVWQLDRAAEQRALKADYDARAAAPPVHLTSASQPADVLRFRRVAVRGYYEPARQILIDNRIQSGRVGYYVITPLRITGTQTRVLVNRGWVPQGPDRQHPPQVVPPVGLQEVTGIATVPAAYHFALVKPRPIKDRWPTVWQYMDMKRYAAAVPFTLQPIVIELDPKNAGGYGRLWEQRGTGITMHEGYAFQWFMMAAALAVIYLWVNTKKVDEVTE